MVLVFCPSSDNAEYLFHFFLNYLSGFIKYRANMISNRKITKMHYFVEYEDTVTVLVFLHII